MPNRGDRKAPGSRIGGSLSDLGHLDPGPAEQPDVLGIGGEDGYRTRSGSCDGGEDGIDRVLVAMEVVAAQQRSRLIRDAPRDVMNVDPGEHPPDAGGMDALVVGLKGG